MSELVTVRDIQTVTTEILMIRRQVEQTALSGAIEIGRRLTEAKDMLPHGEWGRWLREEVEFSQRSANNFMRLYAEYGDRQISMFSANPQAFADLPYTKALQLLAVPEEEREEFAAENHVEDLSSRELEKLIRERDAEKARAETAEAGKADAEQRLENALKLQAGAAEEFNRHRARAEAAEKEAADLAAKLRTAQDKVQKTAAELKALRENPELPKDAMEKLRREAEEAAALDAVKQAAAAQEALRAEKEAAERTAQEAQEAAKKAEEARDRAQRELALANPDAAVFAMLYAAVQEQWNKLHGAWIKAANADGATGEKLKKAARALAEKWAKEEW